jgi:hypothetical protein
MNEIPLAQPVPHVYQAISCVMARLAKEGIGKDRKNEQQGYKFRGIDDVYNALAPLLAESGLCILPKVKSREVVERQTRNGGSLFYVTVDVDFHFVSVKDGSTHVVCMSGEAMDSGDKATNKAMSAAYKYACLQAFCIPTEGDNDADATTHQVVPQEQPTPVVAKEKTKTGHKIIGAEEMNTITNLSELANIPLDVICDKYKITDISQLPVSKTPEVIARLQTIAQENAMKEPA